MEQSRSAQNLKQQLQSLGAPFIAHFAMGGMYDARTESLCLFRLSFRSEAKESAVHFTTSQAPK
jgi:hypothetical protein